MKEKIEKFSRGKFDYELPAIKLSEDKLNLDVTCGKKLTGSVTTGNESGMHMKGIVYSNNSLVTIPNKHFVGSESTIEYVVNAEYQAIGDHIVGELCFVTNCGEITLPYDFKVVPPTLMSIKGEIKDMDEFTELARDDNDEAKRLFATDDFKQFLEYNDKNSVFMWERLLRGQSVDNALEQFLIATRKKLPVVLSPVKKELNYEIGTSSFSDTIKIKKTGWGYVNYIVASDSEALELDRLALKNEDFYGSEATIKFIIYPDRMVSGMNYINITVSGCGKSFTIPVTVHAPSVDRESMTNHLTRSRLTARLIDNELAFAMNQIPLGRYASEAYSVIDGLANLIGSDALFNKLMRIRVLKLSGKESPASQALTGISEDDIEGGSLVAKALYYYLLVSGEYGNKAELMEHLYDLQIDNVDNNFLEFIVTLLEDRCRKNMRLRLDEFRKLFERGYRSPFMYMEAAKILNEEPLFLKDVGEFESCVMLFALKKNFCKRDLAAHYAQLVIKQKGFVKSDLNALMLIYDKFQIDDSLFAICQLLIRGHKKDEKYFKWYQRGVENGVRLGDIYEYYMYSIDKDVEDDLDPAVLLYYIYNSKLTDRRLAYLYANITLHKDANPIIYENYKEKIRIFAMGQMRQCRNDKNLAILYGDLLNDDNYKKQCLEHLSKVLFRYDVTCNNPNMRTICVCHKELCDDVIIPLINGQAQIDVFTEGVTIYMLDAAGNRYIPDDSVVITSLIDDNTLAPLAYSVDKEDDKLLLNLSDKANRLRNYNPTSLEIRKAIVNMPGVNEETKEKYLSDLVLYYYEHAKEEIAEDDIKRLKFRELSPVRRGKYIGLLILRDQLTVAMSLMEECGFKQVELKLLEKFALNLPQAALAKENKTLVEIMYHLYINGKRSEKILVYLVNYYNGPTMDMLSLWQVALLKQVATSDFDERILGQILFTESYLPMAEQVYVHYHRRSKNRMLIKAYFNYLAYKYLVSNVPISPSIMEIFKRDTYFERNDMVTLACLKQMAYESDLSKEEIEFARTSLEQMDSKGMILPCFTNFGKYFPLPENMEDKIYIEYYTNPEHQVTIHIATRIDGKRIVKAEPMRNVCYGLFIKEIVLFSQETIDYVISDDDGEEVVSAERKTLTGPAVVAGNSKSRFNSINNIINARKAEDRSKAIELLNEYVKREFAIDQLFREL